MISRLSLKTNISRFYVCHLSFSFPFDTAQLREIRRPDGVEIQLPSCATDAQKAFEKMKTQAGSWQGTIMGIPLNLTIRAASAVRNSA